MKKFRQFSSSWLFTVLALIAVAMPVAAQEQTGGIEGVVSDSSGGVVPGVTVEVSSSGIGTVVAVSDSRGTYRFPRLPSGVYNVKAELSGYTPAEARNVEVTLGKMATQNLQLSLGSLTESITVTSDAPLVDVTSSATSVSISREQIELIPRGRDFTSIVAQAAGASNEGFLGGISIDGASGSENRFIIDGVDTTHPQNGDAGQLLITDFVEEIQVKSAGYQAEFGGSIGGVINAITKSGTNNLDGSVGLYYGDRDWDGEQRRTPYRANPSLYQVFEVDSTKRFEPFASLGGPIIRDNLWFYLGASQSEFETDRSPVTAAGVNTGTFTQTDTRKYLTGNLKGNIGSKFLYKLGGNLAPRTLDNALPSTDGSTPSGVNLNIDSEFTTSSYSAYADFVPTSSFYVTGRAGVYETDTQVSGTAPGTPRIFFRNGVIPVPTSDPRYRPTGFSTIPNASFQGTEIDLWERSSGSLDGSYFVTALGQHAFKAGVQLENVKNTVATGEVGNLFEIRWGLPDRFGAGVKGTQGSVHVRRFGTFGDGNESNNLGLYVQDSWTVIPSLTLNLGVRTEKEEVPNYGFGQDPTLPKNAFEFGFSEKLAPRLGFSWNVLGNQKLKTYGSWGKYFDIMKLEIARGSFGGDRWIAYLYPLNTLDWMNLPNGCTTSNNDPTVNPCPGLGTPQTLDLRHPTDPRDPIHGIDPDLRPFEQEEFQLGAEYLVTNNSVVGARYVNKQVNAAIEDIGFFSCTTPTQCEEQYFVGNPGLGATATDPAGSIPGQPLAVRDYQALELSYNRRFVTNWSLRASYTYSQLEGNWSGLGSSDEFGRTDPNVSRSFDAIHNSFDQSGRPVFGKLNTDRPHSVDAQFIYRAPFKTSIGVNQYFGSGTPISTQVTYAGVPFFAFGRGDQGRTKPLMQTDLLLTHPLTLGPLALELSLNVLNLLDQDTTQLVDPNYSETDLCSVVAGCNKSAQFFFDKIGAVDIKKVLPQNNPFYLKANSGGSTGDPFQVRRNVRLGVKFTF
ncbi:MAG TPA: TonB-dependent receptor [Thermoanaerobaculia bacterium]|nr:TonB-dependent receptor [Thermoanaerobaculia bacterium]